ncbi:MAG: hypothetical protein GF315_03830 [candidate division Zixibacteria bacterium]|nr:hypothetical protein [candidate division Zixibacteria bacterium]
MYRILKSPALKFTQSESHHRLNPRDRPRIVKAGTVTVEGVTIIEGLTRIGSGNRQQSKRNRRGSSIDSTSKKYSQAEVDRLLDQQRHQLVEQAKRDLEERGSDEYERGYADGYKNGVREGHQSGKQETDKIRNKIEDFFNSIKEDWCKLCSSAESELIKTACMITNKVVLNPKFLETSMIESTLKKTAGAVLGEKELRIKANPADINRINEIAPQLFSSFKGKDSINIIEDEDIAVGGCICETELGRMDATVETRWHEIVNQVLNKGDE